MGGRPFPAAERQSLVNELAHLEHTLGTHGVHCTRVDELAVQPGEEPGLSQNFPRDLMVVIGDTIVRLRPRCPSRKKEERSIDSIIESFKQNGTRVIEMPPGPEMHLEGGDVLVDLPTVYVGVSHGTSLRAVEWLAAEFPELNVVPIHLRSSMDGHLDCCLALIGPKTLIAHLPALKNGLPNTLRDRDVIHVDARVKRELGTNVLMLDPQTAIVQKRHVSLQKELMGRGFTVIPLPFDTHANSEGAFRCATIPLHRSA